MVGFALLLSAAACVQNTGLDDTKLVDELEAAATKIVERVAPSVVAIFVERDAEPAPPQPPNNPSGRRSTPFAARAAGSACSGVVIEPDGLILTSCFNVEGKVRKITVRLHGGAEQEAQLVGYNGTLDIALLKVDVKNLPVLAVADVRSMRIGQTLFVVGRAPDGRSPTLNGGQVSAFGRFGGRCLQFDAETNFGNAGGAVVDADGRLVGVVSKITTRAAASWGQNSGISFCTTIDKVHEALPQLKTGARVAAEKRPFLGVTANQNSKEEGAAIAQVQPGTAAAKAGLKAGDLITEFNGQAIRSWNDLTAAIRRCKPGDRVKLKLRRGSDVLELEVTLGEREEDP